MKIFPILAFKDNYIWTLVDEKSKTAWVVDPGDAAPVIQFFKQHQLQLTGMLITHHHWDHSGGIPDLLNYFGKIPVVASQSSKIKFVSHPLQESAMIDCLDIKLKLLEIPGHTLDHAAFYNDQMIFCGDTLFSAGCGKIFEGNPQQIYASLNKILQLPEEIKIYCGHEYTLANLMFASQVEPHNQAIKNKINEVKKLSEKNQPTLPSVLKDEKLYNPFLRCNEPGVIQAVQEHSHSKILSPVEIFAYLREWKNRGN